MNFVMLSDDTCVYGAGADLNDTIYIDMVKKELVFVNKWMASNCLTLNVNQSYFLIFHRRRRKLPVVIRDVQIRGMKLKRKFSAKYIGAFFMKICTGVIISVMFHVIYQGSFHYFIGL